MPSYASAEYYLHNLLAMFKGTSQSDGTVGGSKPYHKISTADQNATVLKVSGGKVFGICISNSNASARYFKMYDKATAPDQNDIPVLTVYVPGTNGIVRNFCIGGMTFQNGIGFRAVTTMADNGNTGIGAGDLSMDIEYV